MYCTHCGHPLTAHGRFCTHCGHPVPAYSDEQLEELSPEGGKASEVPPESPPEPPPDMDIPETPTEPPEEPPAPPEEPEPADADSPPPPEEPESPEEAPPPESEPEPEPESKPEPEPEPEPESKPESEPEPEPEPEPKPKKRKWLWVAIGAAAVVLIVGVVLVLFFNAQNRAYRDAMHRAEDAWVLQAYSAVIDAYEDALEIKPDKAEPVLGMAKAYICLEDYGTAETLLSRLGLGPQDAGYELQEQLLSLAKLAWIQPQVDGGSFPTVWVSFETPESFALAEDHFTIVEGEQTQELAECQSEAGQFRLSYEAPESFVSEEVRTITVQATVEEATVTFTVDYTTPYFAEAYLSLITTDVSEYPLVRTYFQIVDETGTPLTQLDAGAFQLRERVQGGEFLAREVKSAFLLEENAGLNISLAADKSGSISYEDLDDIQRIMSSFVRQLNFTVGDRAEILAFDDIVQQMCFYTGDINLLLGGIGNMSPGGLTAFYDAVYDGITNSALQGGARCVIAFTDGIDNASLHSSQEVVSCANEKQVPVYIIGVGSEVEADTLRSMAEQTGGQYWHIDDLYDLEAIFQAVYTEQMQLYVVEYESDSSLDAYLSRDLEVRVKGEECRGMESFTFTPVHSLTPEQRDRSERYELVKGAYSWEEADQMCREMGGHLATITSQQEMDTVVDLLESEGLKYTWLGGYTSYDEYGQVYGHWVTGEPFDFEAWTETEPSRVDADGVSEWYIMLWYLPDYGGWSWNDQRNYPFPASTKLENSAGFVCEFEI